MRHLTIMARGKVYTFSRALKGLSDQFARFPAELLLASGCGEQLSWLKN